jgi:Major capsid protein N-terminus
MVASLLRVLTSGIQDDRLDYSDKIVLTSFKTVWRKAGRMTTQWQRIDFNSVPDFGRTVYANILRKGHFISRILLVSTLPDIKTPQVAARAAAAAADIDFVGPNFSWTNSIGHSLVQDATFTSGGSEIERLDSRLLEVLDEYETPLEKVPTINTLIGRKDGGYTETSFGVDDISSVTVYTPLPFWFSRCGPPLPIDAISVDLIQLGVSFRPLAGMYYTDSRDISGNGLRSGASALWPIDGSKFYGRSATSGPTLPNNTVRGIHNLELQNTAPCNGRRYPVAIPGAQMPAASSLHLGDTYLLVEYIYVDRPEANRFRLADLQIPIRTHTGLQPTDTQFTNHINIPLRIGNPTRSLKFFTQRFEAALYNAHFLATRDLNATTVYGQNCPVNAGGWSLWWPDASGLSGTHPGYLSPGFSTRYSEPVQSIALLYEGRLVRYGSSNPSIFRSLLPALEETKAPWLNRYYYGLWFGFDAAPAGHANMDKIERASLNLTFNAVKGSNDPLNVPRYNIHMWAETYNILRLYGGRLSLLFNN